MTLRTDEGRGEVVYQAPFQPAVGSPSRVQVPFSDFRLVRGPIAIPDAPKLANLSAVYQIGFTAPWHTIGTSHACPRTLAGFFDYQAGVGFVSSSLLVVVPPRVAARISEQMQTLGDFRNGTFQLDIAEIGAFSRSSVLIGMEGTPETLPDQEVKRSRPLVARLEASAAVKGPGAKTSTRKA
eukprot:s5558_g5.t1